MSRTSIGGLGQLELFDLSLLGRSPTRHEQNLQLRDWMFFVIRPPPEMVGDIGQLAMDLSRQHDGGRPLSPANLHVTTNFAGAFSTVPDTAIDRLRSIGDAVRGHSFDVVFDRVWSFRGGARHPVVLRCTHGSAQIVALHAAIRGEMERSGLRVPAKTITPHLTLWYGRTPVPEQELRRPFRWTVSEFWLVHSVFGQGRHNLTGHWTLQ
jgi:RNA 2',3'-cyclic 3'-phosphodiesterase